MSSITKDESGRRWRILAHRDNEKIEFENEGAFDELVLGDWLHVEQIDINVWWLRVGDARLILTLSDAELPNVALERGFYGANKGVTQFRE